MVYKESIKTKVDRWLLSFFSVDSPRNPVFRWPQEGEVRTCMCGVTLASYLWIRRGLGGSLVTGYLTKQRELPKSCQRWAHWICAMLQKDKLLWNAQWKHSVWFGQCRKQLLFSFFHPIPISTAAFQFTLCVPWRTHLLLSLHSLFFSLSCVSCTFFKSRSFSQVPHCCLCNLVIFTSCFHHSFSYSVLQLAMRPVCFCNQVVTKVTPEQGKNHSGESLSLGAEHKHRVG